MLKHKSYTNNLFLLIFSYFFSFISILLVLSLSFRSFFLFYCFSLSIYIYNLYVITSIPLILLYLMFIAWRVLLSFPINSFPYVLCECIYIMFRSRYSRTEMGPFLVFFKFIEGWITDLFVDDPKSHARKKPLSICFFFFFNQL